MVYEYNLDNPTSPTVCVNDAITNITFNTTGATGIGTPTNLPTGVTAAWSSNVITISGTPTVAGTFAYSVPLTGGCGTVAATGTITVTGANTAAVPSATPTLCLTMYSQILLLQQLVQLELARLRTYQQV